MNWLPLELRIAFSDLEPPPYLNLRGPTVNPRKKVTKNRKKIKAARKQNRRQK